MFWKLTPREFAAVLEGYHRREQRQFTADSAVAWYGEWFARHKKLPDLEKFLRRASGQTVTKAQQSLDEQLAIIKKWNKALGGEDHTADMIGKD